MTHDERIAVLYEEMRRAGVEAGLTTPAGSPLYRMPSCRCATDAGPPRVPAGAIDLYRRYHGALGLAFERAAGRIRAAGPPP